MNGFWSFVKRYETAGMVLTVALLIPAFVLGVLWAQDPEGNYEPYTFILGVLGTLVGLLTAIAHRMHPDAPPPPTEPPPPREKTVAEMSADEIFAIVEQSDPERDWIRNDEIGTWRIYHRKYPKINFFCDIYEEHYIMNSDFREPWANRFSDPKAEAFYYDLRLGETVLKRFPLISVDGHRALLPLPHHSDMTVDLLAYKVARINDETGQTDEYVNRAGIKVKDA